jgi:hypothetical protein
MALTGLVATNKNTKSVWVRIKELRQNDTACLAPKFRAAVDDGIAAIRAEGHDAVVFETCRTDELARIYFEQGTSKAPNARRTWHGYGLAVDIISGSKQWNIYPHHVRRTRDGKRIYMPGDPEFLECVTRVFKARGLKWGGDWTRFKDWPHWQWGRCKPSPSDVAVTLYRQGGVEPVWRAVGAS